MRNSSAKKKQVVRRGPAIPMWAAFAVVISMAVMLCLSINYRAFKVMSEEYRENEQLTELIQNVTDENLQLQEEIHDLKSNARVIEREARRLGLVPMAKVSVPVN